MIGREPKRSTRGPRIRPTIIRMICPIVSAKKNAVRDQPNSSIIWGAKTAETEVWTPTAMNWAVNAAATTIQP